MSAPTTYPAKFQGCWASTARCTEYIFLFVLEKVCGYGGLGARMQPFTRPLPKGAASAYLRPLHPKSGKQRPLRDVLNQTCWFRRRKSLHGKRFKAIAVLPFQTLAREEKHPPLLPTPRSGFWEKQRVKLPADLC